MATYAIIQNDTVVNLVVADSAQAAIDATGAEEVLEVIGQAPWFHWKRSGNIWSMQPITQPEEPVVND